MRKIETSHDLRIPGFGIIEKGTPFTVEKYNKRFVYVRVSTGASLRLARKSDCVVIY